MRSGLCTSSRPKARTAHCAILRLRLLGRWGRLLRSAPGWLDGLGADAALWDGFCMLVGRRPVARTVPLLGWDSLLFGSSVVR